MDLNKAIIVGNLTRDPEERSLPSGVKVCSFSLATNRVWKDKDGNQQKSTDFHNIVVFGRQAETSAQYLKKGQEALVEGRIQTRSWDGQDGQKKYRTEIVADRVQFGSRSQGGGSPAADQSDTQAGADRSEGKGGNSGSGGDQIDYPEEEINPEDIPF